MYVRILKISITKKLRAGLWVYMFNANGVASSRLAKF